MKTGNRGIFALPIVYNCAHLHTVLRTEGGMLDINWLQEVCNIQGEIVFQILQNLWVAKAVMSSYNLCKILSFQARVAQKLFNTSGSNSQIPWNGPITFSRRRTNLFVAPSETQSLMLTPWGKYYKRRFPSLDPCIRWQCPAVRAAVKTVLSHRPEATR